MPKDFLSTLRNYFIIICFFIIIICIFFIPFFNNDTITTISTSENTNYQITTSNGFCWPIPGYTRISSYFGYRKAPTVGATSFHGGVDIPAPSGTNLISAITGKGTCIPVF